MANEAYDGQGQDGTSEPGQVEREHAEFMKKVVGKYKYSPVYLAAVLDLGTHRLLSSGLVDQLAG